jgi:hypothetical protein
MPLLDGFLYVIAREEKKSQSVMKKIAALEDSLAMTGFTKSHVPPEPVIAREAKQSLTHNRKIVQFC